ncbi:MAG: DUF4902 domain-containing protein [Rudaea sp.]
MRWPAGLSTNANLIHAQNGHVRLTFQHFCSLRFPWRIMFTDFDLRDELVSMNVPVSKAWFCKSRDAEEPVRVSIGRGWFVTAWARVQRVATGGVSCNIVLIANRWQRSGLNTHR